MKRTCLALLLTLFSFLSFTCLLPAQEIITRDSLTGIVDSLISKGLIIKMPKEKPDIRLQRENAIRYLQSKYLSGDWTNPSDPFRSAIGQLIYLASVQPFDTLKSYFGSYSFDTLNIPWDRFYKWDTIRVRIPDPEFVSPGDSFPRADTIIIVARDSIINFLPYSKNNPFWIYKNPWQGDSLAAAVKSLTDYLTERDSSIINFRGIGNSVIPVWLNSKTNILNRYWLKNDIMDSVTVWVGSLERNTIDLFLEEGIMFRRPSKQTNISEAQLNLKEINTAGLHDLNKIYVKPRYWKLRAEANFVFNQALLSNWVKGGESSISTTMDITGYANYTNKNIQLSSSNFARLKYGLVYTKDNGVRKNLDLIETNSKLNHKAFGKVDFSATMLFKTQLTVGKNYFKVEGRDTSIVASKFFNPATLTIGLGFDYKPDKNTSINFAPLSYKGTYVLDTALIDQTKYGVPRDKRSLNEPGASLQISNVYRPAKNISITNRFQLFTNYIHNPLNIDVDWEMIAIMNLNWFTDVRINTHLIYDDDTRTGKLDKSDNPILGDDGKPRKSPRVQFKELIGFTFVFRF